MKRLRVKLGVGLSTSDDGSVGVDSSVVRWKRVTPTGTGVEVANLRCWYAGTTIFGGRGEVKTSAAFAAGTSLVLTIPDMELSTGLWTPTSDATGVTIDAMHGGSALTFHFAKAVSSGTVIYFEL